MTTIGTSTSRPKNTNVPAGAAEPRPEWGAADLLGPPALIAGEDEAHYAELLDRVLEAVSPADFLEEMWVRDIVDLRWQALRYRRLQANLLQAARHEGLTRVLTRLVVGPLEADDLAGRWARQEAPAIKEVKRHLAAAGLTLEAVMAETLAARLDDIERIEHMIAETEARFAAALRELDRHRAVLAEALRNAPPLVDDAAFEPGKPRALGAPVA